MACFSTPVTVNYAVFDASIVEKFGCNLLKLLEFPRKTVAGMVVAHLQACDFCTNNLGSEWLTKGGKGNALDDICNSFGVVAGWCR